MVSKLDKSEDPTDPGFSMFWLLFIPFLFFGICLCCSALLIFGAAPGSASDLNDTADNEQHDAENPAEPSNETPVATPIVGPESVPEDKDDETSAEVKGGDVEKAVDKEEAAEASPENMDDLD
ncbi:MAG: hypothetical protein SGARI_004468 [Bacillariaceae sp.]